MNNITKAASSGNSPFDSICRIDEQGKEFWSARELMPVLGYQKWENFSRAIKRAKRSCENIGNPVGMHFFLIIGSGDSHSTQNWGLSRHACYLVAMNCDPDKPEIAAAQNYFAVKAREAELQDTIPKAEFDAMQQSIADLKERMLRLELENSMIEIAHGLSKEADLWNACKELMQIRDRWCESLGLRSFAIGDRAFSEAVKSGKVPDVEPLLPVLRWGKSNGISRGSLMRIRKRLESGEPIRSLERPKDRKIDIWPEIADWLEGERIENPDESIVSLHRRLLIKFPHVEVSLSSVSRWLEEVGL